MKPGSEDFEEVKPTPPKPKDQPKGHLIRRILARLLGWTRKLMGIRK
jgi:hypothetical protein